MAPRGTKVSAVHLGTDPTSATYVKPLSSSADRMQWGRAYLVVNDAEDEATVNYVEPQRRAFAAGDFYLSAPY